MFSDKFINELGFFLFSLTLAFKENCPSKFKSNELELGKILIPIINNSNLNNSKCIAHQVKNAAGGCPLGAPNGTKCSRTESERSTIPSRRKMKMS